MLPAAAAVIARPALAFPTLLAAFSAFICALSSAAATMGLGGPPPFPPMLSSSLPNSAL